MLTGGGGTSTVPVPGALATSTHTSSKLEIFRTFADIVSGGASGQFHCAGNAFRLRVRVWFCTSAYRHSLPAFSNGRAKSNGPRFTVAYGSPPCTTLFRFELNGFAFEAIPPTFIVFASSTCGFMVKVTQSLWLLLSMPAFPHGTQTCWG